MPSTTQVVYRHGAQWFTTHINYDAKATDIYDSFDSILVVIWILSLAMWYVANLAHTALFSISTVSSNVVLLTTSKDVK